MRRENIGRSQRQGACSLTSPSCSTFLATHSSRHCCCFARTCIVSFGVFFVVRCAFIPPAPFPWHLEEIDQVFSRVGVALRQSDAPTRNILGKHIVGSYKKNVSSFPVRITHLFNCGNLRDLLRDHMFAIPSVTKPQAFRVSKDPADNKVKLQVQARGYENKWAAIDRYIKSTHLDRVPGERVRLLRSESLFCALKVILLGSYVDFARYLSEPYAFDVLSNV